MLKLSVIKEILTDKKINLTGFSESSGIPYHIIYNVLHGPKPPYKNVEKISDYIEQQRLNDFMQENNPFKDYKKVGE